MDNIEKNKNLIKRFPFLLPRNRFTDKVPEDYNYSYTELDAMPDGWRKLFGELLCEDIKNELLTENPDLLEKYRITQIKEKYGSLRWYSNFTTEKIEEIIEKYTRISAYTCIKCGLFPVPTIDDGWMRPLCFSCYTETKNKIKTIYTKNLYQSEISKNFEPFSQYINIEGFKDGKRYKKTIDAGDILEKIKKVGK